MKLLTPADTDLALPSSALPSLGSPGGRRWEECRLGDECMQCVARTCNHGCAHLSRASHAALLPRWQPTEGSLQCHCTARVPSSDAPSSRAGVVGRVQSITKAFFVQACIGLDLYAAHTRLHAPPCGDGMIAPFVLECNPEACNGPPNIQAWCLHPPGVPLSPQTQIHTYTGHPWLVRTAAKSASPQK